MKPRNKAESRWLRELREEKQPFHIASAKRIRWIKRNLAHASRYRKFMLPWPEIDADDLSQPTLMKRTRYVTTDRTTGYE